MAHLLRSIRGKVANFICTSIAPEFVIINKSIDPFAEGLIAEDGTSAALCAKYLVAKAEEGGQDYLKVEFGGFTVAGHDCGNWSVVVKRDDHENVKLPTPKPTK